jgi:hypothetical protein
MPCGIFREKKRAAMGCVALCERWMTRPVFFFDRPDRRRRGNTTTARPGLFRPLPPTTDICLPNEFPRPKTTPPPPPLPSCAPSADGDSARKDRALSSTGRAAGDPYCGRDHVPGRQAGRRRRRRRRRRGGGISAVFFEAGTDGGERRGSPVAGGAELGGGSTTAGGGRDGGRKRRHPSSPTCRIRNPGPTCTRRRGRGAAC